MRPTRRSGSISKSLSVGTPGSEATASRSRARSSVVMSAEASALCIALRRVGDDLAVIRFEASGTRLASLDKPERQRISRPDGDRDSWGHGRCHPNHGRSRHRRCDVHPRSSTGAAERLIEASYGLGESVVAWLVVPGASLRVQGSVSAAGPGANGCVLTVGTVDH